MKWVRFSQALLPLAVWVLCLRQRIEMWDFFPHLSESKHRHYFPSPESLIEPHKTRILLSDEYTIYIRDFFRFHHWAKTCLPPFLFTFLFQHCIWYGLDAWHNSSYQRFTLSICFCGILFWIWDWNTSASPLYLHSFGFGQLLQIHVASPL